MMIRALFICTLLLGPWIAGMFAALLYFNSEVSDD